MFNRQQAPVESLTTSKMTLDFCESKGSVLTEHLKSVVDPYVERAAIRVETVECLFDLPVGVAVQLSTLGMALVPDISGVMVEHVFFAVDFQKQSLRDRLEETSEFGLVLIVVAQHEMYVITLDLVSNGLPGRQGAALTPIGEITQVIDSSPGGDVLIDLTEKFRIHRLHDLGRDGEGWIGLPGRPKLLPLLFRDEWPAVAVPDDISVPEMGVGRDAYVQIGRERREAILDFHAISLSSASIR